MGSPGGIQGYVKWEMEDGSDKKIDRARDAEECEGDDNRKHMSNKSRKPGNGEEAEGLDGSGRKENAVDRNESRKRSGGSSRVDSDEEDQKARKESFSKQMKRQQEEGTLEMLSNWYQDGEQENKHDGGERRKSTSNRIEGKDYLSHEIELEKALDRDTINLEWRDTNGEKDHAPSEQGRSRRRRWDESEAAKKPEASSKPVEKSDKRNGMSCDLRRDSAGEGSVPSTIKLNDNKSRVLDSYGLKGMKSKDKEDERIDSERSKREGWSEAPEGVERIGKQRQQRNSASWDAVESRDRSFNEDDGSWMREKSRRELDHSNRSKTLEKSGRRYHESENLQLDYEKGNSFKLKKSERGGYRDDRSKVRDDVWSERDMEGSRDDWKRRQPNDMETKDGDMSYDNVRAWELRKHGRDNRPDNERPRSGCRKDTNRTEDVKTSSNYGISNENSDVIEIQAKPFDFGRGESRSTISVRTEGSQQSDTKWAPNDQCDYSREDRDKRSDEYGAGEAVDDSKERFIDDGRSTRDQNSWRGGTEFQGGKNRVQKGSQIPHGNQEQNSNSYNRAVPQGVRGGRTGRVGRGRPNSGRDFQPSGISVPRMPPPGQMQPLNPKLSPAPGSPFSPGVFSPPFAPPVIWPGARGIDMSMLAVPPGLSSIPPGPPGPRFFSIPIPPHPAIYFNQPCPGRGDSPNINAPDFNAIITLGRGQPPDKASGNWVPPRTNVPPGKAPSRGEQNDYSQNFVDTGMHPQNFIRELEITTIMEDYPKLRELIQKKDEIVANATTPPMYFKCDLREHVLLPEFFGTKFDVILVDPPWEEYVHRAPGVADHLEYWTFEEIMNLKIEAIADTPSFIFLWVGDGVGLEQGRQCLKKWGFRRCEDICWVKTNKLNGTPGLRHDSHTLFQRSKEHCLMGIKGTVRRSTDGHIIHANIDTDVIIAEEPPYGSTAKPEDMYRIVEHFALGRRRLELFGEDHNIRSGWLTLGKGLSSSNFNSEAFIRNFADKDGKVWQGDGGRNPPPEAPHLILTTPDIESLRPQSPMKNQQQLQQSTSLCLTPADSSKIQTGNSPQSQNAPTLNQEVSSSSFSTPGPLASPMESFSDDRLSDMFGSYNLSNGQANVDFRDFETERTINLV